MAGEKYLKAVIEAADAVPLIIPVLADDLAIDELVDQVDGVLLTGSPSDIEPHHYGGESDDPDALRDPHRDALTLPIARHALETGVPVTTHTDEGRLGDLQQQLLKNLRYE